MILICNPKRLLKLDFSKHHLFTGTYRDHKWVIYNLRKSIYDTTCIDYNLDIISLKTGRVVFHGDHTSMNLILTIRGMNRRLEKLIYYDYID